MWMASGGILVNKFNHARESAMKRPISAMFAVAVLLCGGLSGALAQAYPNRAIRMVAPYVAGSPVDVFARVLTQHASPRVGQPIIAENRPGAGTTIGSRAVATATPDGYTLLMSGQGLAVMPYFYPKVDIDPLKNFVSIGSLAGWNHVLIVANRAPVKTLAEFVSYAKANPGDITHVAYRRPA